MWIQRFSSLKTPSTHHTLKCSKECNFGSLGQNVAQIHTISFAICQRVTPIPRPNTDGIIGIVRQGAAFCSRCSFRLLGWTFVVGLCHMLDISLPQTSRPGITGKIRTPPVAVFYPLCCNLKTRVDTYWPYHFSFGKEKTRLGTKLELQSNWHSNQPKLLKKLPYKSFLSSL